MRSADGDADRRPSLARRVVGATVLSAVLAALVAAAVSLVVAERVVRTAADRRLEQMARVALGEMPVGESAAALRDAVLKEEGELAPGSMRLAVWHAGRLVGGDARLPHAVDGCVSVSVDEGALRACGVQARGIEVVVGSAGALHPPAAAAMALLVAAVVAAAAAAAFGRRAAGWALAPLRRLRDELGSLQVPDPEEGTEAAAHAARSDEACEEVAAVRSAIAMLLAKLGDALGTARRFSADAAHELRTPLTTIRAELDLLAEEELAPSARAAVARLSARAVAMAKLVDALLVLANSADGRARDVSAVALEDVVRDAIGRLAAPVAARVNLEVEAQGIALGDEVLLGAMVENLVDNALKFSGSAPIEVRVCEVDGQVVVRVRDRGPGLSPDEQSRAFEPFFRSPEARGKNLPGHGIGLALVAHIARVHGGTVRFVPRAPGEDGAEVEVRLPLHGATPPARR